MNIKDTFSALGRHLATILVVLGIVWGIGRPHAQGFIEDTVEERFKKLEEETQELTRSIGVLVDGQKDEARQSQFESQALGEVLCRLRAEENERDPDECSR